MKTKKPIYLVIAGLIGCAICAVPLLLPIAAGVFGVSILGFSLSHVLCGVLLLGLAIALFGVIIAKRKSVNASPCE